MNTGVIWFRNALRLNDNRVLVECLNSTNSQTILPLYILDKNDLEQNNNENRIKFLYESLIDLDANFKNKFGSNLIVLNGKSEEVFRKLLNSELLDIANLISLTSKSKLKKMPCVGSRYNLLLNGVEILKYILSIIPIQIIIASQKGLRDGILSDLLRE